MIEDVFFGFLALSVLLIMGWSLSGHYNMLVIHLSITGLVMIEIKLIRVDAGVMTLIKKQD